MHINTGIKVMTDSETICVSYNGWMQIFPWSIVGFLIWATVKFINAYGFSSPILLVLGIFLIWSVVRAIKQPRGFDIDNNSVAIVGWFWKRELKWDEIASIQYLQSRKGLDGIGFVKKGKGIIFFKGSSNWWDTDYKRVLEMLEYTAAQHNIRVYPTKSGSMFVL